MNSGIQGLTRLRQELSELGLKHIVNKGLSSSWDCPGFSTGVWRQGGGDKSEFAPPPAGGWQQGGTALIRGTSGGGLRGQQWLGEANFTKNIDHFLCVQCARKIFDLFFLVFAIFHPIFLGICRNFPLFFQKYGIFHLLDFLRRFGLRGGDPPR